MREQLYPENNCRFCKCGAPILESNGTLFNTSKEKYSLTNKNGEVVNLTSRESDCISIIIQGRTMKEIGRMLNLSPRTVERHIDNIKQKFEVHSKGQLIDIFQRSREKTELSYN